MQDHRYEIRIAPKLKKQFHNKVEKKSGGLIRPSVVVRAMILDYIRGKYDPFEGQKQ